jgi:predicted SAM-dependent methyltransferase
MTLKQDIGRWVFARMPITRNLFDQLRIEANAVEVWGLNHVSPAHMLRLRKLRALRDTLVNVGCGPHVEPGFINLDLASTAPGVVRWDCRRELPLGDGSARGIRIEHFFEHLETREEAPALLRDCARVLQPGGVLRIVVPDARRYLEAYLKSDRGGFEALGMPVPFPSDLPTRMDVLNHIFHQGHEHRAGYDFESLAHRLEAAGFTSVQRMDFRSSLLPSLACDREVHAPYSLYVDAVRAA